MFQDGANQQGPPGSAKPSDLSSLEAVAKLLKDATKSNMEFLKGLQEIETRSFSIAKNFGLTKSEIESITKATVTATNELIQYGATQETAYKQQLEVGKVLGRNLILSTDVQKGLFLASQTSGQAADKIAGSFKDAGFSLSTAGNQMNTVINTAREIGVNANAVSAKVLENTSLLNKYNFDGGVQGLAKMAANASALRIDMKETLNFAEKVYNPEGAIEAAAALQRLGVAQSDLLDPLKLLDLAQNDPTELQNQISQMSKQFVRMKEDGSFEILPGAKRQLREIEQALGFSSGQLSKMALSSAELDTKLSKIKFPEFATEEQKKLLANITEMGAGGAIQLNVGGELKDINEVLSKVSSKEEFQKLVEQGERKDPKDLAELQRSSTDNLRISIEKLTNRLPRALALTPGGPALLDISVKSMEGLAGIFDKAITKAEKNIVPGISDVAVILDKTLTEAIDKGDFFGALKKGGEAFLEIGGILKENFGGSVEKLGTALSTFFSNTTNLNTAMENLPDLFDDTTEALEKFKEELNNPTTTTEQAFERLKKKAKDTIITPNSEVELLPEDTIIAGTGLEFIKDLIKSPIQPQITESIKTNINSDTTDLMRSIKNEISSTTKTPTEITVNFKMSLDVSGTNSSQIDTNKIIMMLNDQGVKEKLVQVTKEALTERGQRIIYPG